MNRIVIAAALSLIAMSAPAYAAAPHLNATCPSGITVKINKGGTVRINGEKVQVKEVNANFWEATHNGVTISIAKTGNELTVSYTGKDGANGICQVTAEDTSEKSGKPSKDEKACLEAVTAKTNNKKVKVLETKTSEANNTVIIGVGEERAKWQCLVKDGKVSDVMSLTNEGAL